MKKLVMILFFIILVLCITIYAFHYKNFEEINQLLAKGMEIRNVYYEHFVTLPSYQNNIKQYKMDKFVKDDIYVYHVLDRTEYINFNTGECIVYNDNYETPLDIENCLKFNDYSNYFDLEKYSYHYVMPTICDGIWCDLVKLINKESSYKIYFYIDKDNGVVIKQVGKDKNGNKDIQEFKYSYHVVTDEQIAKPAISTTTL